jgi:phosphonopyruvate decarboxylase
MLSPQWFFDALREAGVEYFSGVPDSLLKAFCAYVSDNVDASRHVIAANEGAAVGLAMGYHLASGKVPLVYLQNSGLGNLVNPLMSLVDSEVYNIPMILLIGWRGEPGVKDEPQHVKQGRVTIQTLDALEIPYGIIDGDKSQAADVIKKALSTATKTSSACAIVVKKGAFDSYTIKTQTPSSFGWQREDAVKYIVDALDDDDIVVATTGMASRELFEYREALGQGHEKDFLTVGGMGHASQIALGIAAQKPNRRVVCIDGDGASLMHMGSMAICGQSALGNFKHIIVNNGAHDSVGGQPTAGFAIDLVKIADACLYESTARCESESQIKQSLKALLSTDSTAMLEIRVDKGNRKDLGRPTKTPQENKKAFMHFVQS